ncbi:uncharacterized protein [Drosophila pseudoobscura]|uniref:Uncharacterized protein n=1 Tax=Drosophila pseudoobscura pseudoobscura TaxID=46245 RepID=A0A6I8VA21_DROPS|nr:uncharacterized protein LOC26533818 [Drosophila pseudoobscura]
MSDPHRGLRGHSKLRLYLWIYGTALVFIFISILLIISFGFINNEPDKSCCPAAFSFFSLGLLSMFFYMNMMFLRRKFPINWIMSCSMAVVFGLGTASMLCMQTAGHVILLALEVIVMMGLLLLLGYWLPPKCHPLLYIALTSFILAVIAFFLCKIISDHTDENHDKVAVWIARFVLWTAICPLLLFQSQVINGYWGNESPYLDIPLCSILLLIDFLACYAFLDAVDDIEIAYDRLFRSETVGLIARVGRSGI